MIRNACALVLLGVCAAAHAQNLVRGEYWVDEDQGWGQNHAFTINADNDTAGVALAIDLTGETAGLHTLGIRTLDSDGGWSLSNSTPIVVTDAPSTPDVVAVRYFLNEDPGFAAEGTAWSGNSPDVQNTTTPLVLTGAVEGTNTLFLRTLAADGRWGITNHVAISVTHPDEQGVVDAVETFPLPSGDPGIGQADNHLFSAPDIDLVDSLFNAPVPVQFALGDTLMMRTHDSRGIWSLTNYVVIDGSTSSAQLEKATGISVYPNPFADAFTVDPSTGGPLRVFIYGPTGQLCYDQFINGTTRVALNGSAGAYTACFWNKGEPVYRLKLIKR